MAVHLILPDWVTNPPDTFEGKIRLLAEKKHLLTRENKVGEFLRGILKEVKQIQKDAETKARRLEPLAFVKASYEQALILNAWIFGISYVCVYAANRIGKTAACIFNFLLWIFPNKPHWRIFKPYIVGEPHDDPENSANVHAGLQVHVLRRPDIATLAKLTHLAKNLPTNIDPPDPNKQYYDPANKPYIDYLKTKLPEAFTPAYPFPAWNHGGTIWTGAPDHDHFVQVIMPMWRQYVPEQAIEQDTETTRQFTFKISQPDTPNQNFTMWKWIGKSYESKDTKWSSGAVDAIVLTEGVLPSIWSEIKARFKDPGIGSHDFTPYEPANSGAATHLANRILKGTEEVPLRHHVFTGFSVYNCPKHIISPTKLEGLIKAYRNSNEAQARLDGTFFTSSSLVLSNLNRENHLLDWTFEELRNKFSTCQLYRGLDPGLDHPTAIAWGALLPTNQWVIYRIFSQAGLSISQRCEKMATLSNNVLAKKRHGPGPQDFYLQETHPSPTSEVIIATATDYHIFKEDETTGQSYALNYLIAGITVTESVHTGPEQRASLLDDLLKPNQFAPHILTNRPPGPRVYFLKNEPGIMAAFLKWEELYWDRKRSGDDKGTPKDKVPTHGDDELDAVCYLTSSPFKWTNYRPNAIMVGDSEPSPRLSQVSQTFNLRRQRIQSTSTNPTLQPLQTRVTTKLHPQGGSPLQSPKAPPSYFGSTPEEAEENERIDQEETSFRD